MKSIDIKSLIIGALLTSTIFLGVAAQEKIPPELQRAINATPGKVWGTLTKTELEEYIESKLEKAFKFKDKATEKELSQVFSLIVKLRSGWEPFSCKEHGEPVYRKMITLRELAELDDL